MTTPIYGFPQIEIGQLQRGKDQKFNTFAQAVEDVLTGLSTVYQPLDADLTAISALSTTGIAVRTAADTWATRTLIAPAAGMTIANPAGIAGNPTFALANDLSALEGLASTGIAVRSAADTWVQRTITGTTNKVDITNGNGVSGNPTITLPSVISQEGIAFPATQVPSAGANVLDDYEEGTWTPTLTFSVPGDLAVVYGSQVGSYTKIGNMLHWQFLVSTTTWTHSTATTQLRVSGLPFASNPVAVAAAAIGFSAGQPTGASTQMIALASGAQLLFYYTDRTTGGSAFLDPTRAPSGTQQDLRCSGTYKV